VFVVAGLGVGALVAALIIAAAVSDFRVASAAYRHLDRLTPQVPAPWWYVGGRVKLTLLAGVVGCTIGIALLLADRLGESGRVAGAAVLAIGTLLLTAGELTRHRLISR
jgi:hypothetical protein